MNLIPWRSLKARVTALTLAIFLIGIWSLAFYVSRMLREDMQRVAGEQLFSTVSFIAEEIGDQLGDRVKVLEKVAGKITPATLDNPAALQAFLEDRLILQGPFNGGVVCVGPDGTAIAAVPHTIGIVGVNLMDRDHIVGALKEGKVTIGRPVIGKKVVSPIFVMAVPIRDSRGKIIGAVTGLTDLSKPSFLDQVTEGHYGKTGGYVLVDTNHRLIVTATDKRLVMTPISQPATDPLIDRFIQGYEGSGVLVNPVGVEVLASAKRIPAANWYVAAALPTREAFAPIDDMQRRTLLITLFLTLLTGGITWWMLRHQLAPMLATVKTLAALSESSQTLRPLPISRQDEVGELIGGFNRLLETLGEREEALRDLAGNLREAQEAGRVGSYVLDIPGDAWRSSPMMDEILGISADYPRTLASWTQILHPDEREPVNSYFREVVAEHRPFSREYRIVRANDGAERWVYGRGKAEYSASGAALRMIGIVQDITERKRIEVTLRESENYLAAIFQASPIAIVVSRVTDGLILDGNEAALALYGFARDEAIGRTAAELGMYANLAQRAELVQRLREQGAIERFPLDFRRRNGEVGAIEVSGRMVELKGEECLVSLLVDVTEHNMVEERLRKAVAFADSLSEAMPLPVFHKDASGRYSGCNDAFTHFIGKTRNEIIGKTVFEVSPQSYATTYKDKDLELLGEPIGTQTYESRVAHADGSVHDVIFHKARLTDSAGRPTGIVGVITDITELKQINAKQAYLEGQLRESQKMESLGTLAGGIAHDFNNIVASIIGNTELARQDIGSGHPALESLEEIRKAGRRAADLVQQILAFGRRQKLERQVISLVPVVQEAGSLLRSTLPAGISLTVHCETDVPAVLADATQIEQVVLNLCSNAWHAIREHEQAGTIEVLLKPELRKGERFASLTVQDNGIGMDGATQSRIFEPFFTTKPVGEGTGLGLSVVHGILKEHGASIEVDSAPGNGTSFVILFPAAKESGQIVETHKPKIAPAHGQGKRVLYIDDDESIVFLMQRLLERQGYRVSGFTDPREALLAARTRPDDFDLAVTDYNMPGISGLEVARQLREIRADLPVALASGYVTDKLREEAPEAGVSELIYKPNTVEDLCEAVARLAQKAGETSKSS